MLSYLPVWIRTVLFGLTISSQVILSLTAIFGGDQLGATGLALIIALMWLVAIGLAPRNQPHIVDPRTIDWDTATMSRDHPPYDPNLTGEETSYTFTGTVSGPQALDLIRAINQRHTGD